MSKSTTSKRGTCVCPDCGQIVHAKSCVGQVEEDGKGGVVPVLVCERCSSVRDRVWR
jgi:hypothetical protein